jgi:hypothetical protein
MAEKLIMNDRIDNNALSIKLSEIRPYALLQRVSTVGHSAPVKNQQSFSTV